MMSPKISEGFINSSHAGPLTCTDAQREGSGQALNGRSESKRDDRPYRVFS